MKQDWIMEHSNHPEYFAKKMITISTLSFQANEPIKILRLKFDNEVLIIRVLIYH